MQTKYLLSSFVNESWMCFLAYRRTSLLQQSSGCKSQNHHPPSVDSIESLIEIKALPTSFYSLNVQQTVYFANATNSSEKSYLLSTVSSESSSFGGVLSAVQPQPYSSGIMSNSTLLTRGSGMFLLGISSGLEGSVLFVLFASESSSRFLLSESTFFQVLRRFLIRT